MHDRADSGADETRPNIRVLRALPVRSLSYGLIGKCDVVEAEPLTSSSLQQPDDDGEWVPPPSAARLPARAGWWRIRPVEYKRGRPKPDDCDLVQLTAQALCLEEMFAVEIEAGSIYYGQPRRRLDVALTAELRARTFTVIRRLRQMMESGRSPAATYSRKCDHCSLYDLCRPKNIRSDHSARAYLAQAIERARSQMGEI
jgi:CRISPR-associated exonuclease Cas4